MVRGTEDFVLGVISSIVAIYIATHLLDKEKTAKFFKFNQQYTYSSRNKHSYGITR